MPANSAEAATGETFGSVQQEPRGDVEADQEHTSSDVRPKRSGGVLLFAFAAVIVAGSIVHAPL